MQQYIGVKIVKMFPMNRLEYNIFRGWQLPADENGADEGYLVEYLDGGKPNVDGYKGYVSWSPKEQAERAYRPTNGMSFGLAIEAAKKGYKIARANWNGKSMFVVYMEPLSLPPYNTQGTTRKVNDRTAKWIGEDQPLESQGYFAMYCADKTWQPGWLASQRDMLSDDWVIVE